MFFLKIFFQFKSLFEKQSGYYIKVSRTKKGGEYISNVFLKICKDHGIQKQFTTRYNPQKYHVTERKSKTIMDMAMSMLKYKNMSNE